MRVVSLYVTVSTRLMDPSPELRMTAVSAPAVTQTKAVLDSNKSEVTKRGKLGMGVRIGWDMFVLMLLRSMNCGQRNNDLLRFPADWRRLATKKRFT